MWLSSSSFCCEVHDNHQNGSWVPNCDEAIMGMIIVWVLDSLFSRIFSHTMLVFSSLFLSSFTVLLLFALTLTFAVLFLHHSSTLDVCLLHGKLGERPSHNFRIPIVGWAMKMAGNILLIRNSAHGQMDAYLAMLRMLLSKDLLVVFTDGK